jgi:Tfp pilus assembly protein PilN
MGDGVTGQAWLTAEAPPSRVLAELGEVLPPDVRLDGLSLTYGRRLEVEMRVVARSPRAYDLLLERLQASPRLKDLVLGAENREGEVQTTIHASFEPGP